jgi:hypothetical protein
LKEGSERLEPYDGKPSRTVLRGGSDGNISSLPDYLEFFSRYDFEEDRLEVVEVICSSGDRRDGAVFDGLYHGAISKFQEVERRIEARTVPPRQYQLGTWRCDYCSYVDICYSSYEEEVKSMATEVELDGISELVRDYFEASSRLKEIEKSKNDLNEAIRGVLKSLGVRQGKTDGLLVSLSVQRREKIEKELIPRDILKEVTREYLVDVLNIRSLKGGNKNGQSHQEQN